MRVSAEEAAAMREAAERLESALGHEVKLRRRAGELVAEIHFDELDEVDAEPLDQAPPRRLTPPGGHLASLSSPSLGRLAQSVRALL